jgi:DNA-binding MarR family transcriptional regulator
MNKQEIKQFMALIQQFRTVDPEMQAQTILTILNVALHEEHPDGYCIKDLSEQLGLTQASASRNVMSWSHLTRAKVKGPDFIQALECPVNRSRKRLSMTLKGRLFLESIFPS